MASKISNRRLKENSMTKEKITVHRGFAKPRTGYHAGRNIHGDMPPVTTTHTKTAPKAPKPKAPHTKKFKVP
jgi:hypothetical protein